MSKRVLFTVSFLLIAGFVVDGIAAALPSSNGTLIFIGGFFVILALVLTLIADWKGFVTLHGKIEWNRNRVLLGFLFYMFSPFVLAAYLVQAYRIKPAPKPLTAIDQYALDGNLYEFERRIEKELLP